MEKKRKTTTSFLLFCKFLSFSLNKREKKKELKYMSFAILFGEYLIDISSIL